MNPEESNNPTSNSEQVVRPSAPNSAPVPSPTESPTGQPAPAVPPAPNRPPAAPVPPSPKPPVPPALSTATPETPSSQPPSFQSSSSSGGSSKKVLKLVIGLVILALLVVGGYFGYKMVKDSRNKASVNKALESSTQSNKNSGATDIASLNDVSLAVPEAALAGLKAGDTSNPNAKQYFTADDNCFVVYGTATPELLPGKDISEIVNAYLNRVREAGATVGTPTAGDPRILKTEDGKRYSIPSLKFSFTSSQGEQVMGYYSGAVLKGKTRVVVDTSCRGTDAARMANIEKIVEAVRVTVK